MDLIVDINPEVGAALSRQAAAHGVDLRKYAAGLLEEAAQIPAAPKSLNQGRLEETLRELAQFSNRIPLLPDEAFTRESLYLDRD